MAPISPPLPRVNTAVRPILPSPIRTSPTRVPLPPSPDYDKEPPFQRVKPRKRALLIGIQYDKNSGNEYPKLHTPHADVETFKKLLKEVYHFAEEDITVMLDKSNVARELYPTRVNIIYQINQLVRGAVKGDSLVFLYAGHSDQIPNKTGSEDDKMDEIILPVDHRGRRESTIIVDNDLKKLLVDPLPAGARLTAVFDACHSGTLLDLQHYLSNSYNTGISQVKPRRMSTNGKTERRRSTFAESGKRLSIYQRFPKDGDGDGGDDETQTRKQSLDILPSPQTNGPPAAHSLMRQALTKSASRSSTRSTIRQSSLDSYITPHDSPVSTSRGGRPSFQPLGAVVDMLEHDHEKENEVPMQQTMSPLTMTSPLPYHADAEEHDAVLCASPGSISRVGSPVQEDPDPANTQFNVLSISACRDFQTTYEDLAGEIPSLIQILVKLLRDEPRPSLETLMQRTGSALKDAAWQRVKAYRDMRKDEIAAKGGKPDAEQGQEAHETEHTLRSQPMFGTDHPVRPTDTFNFLATVPGV